ncbi:MAG: glycosyltransferase family 2 protein [Gemmatimonadota bacterium]|nr:glycosyltransferase family 2 protein [Gemmatimonadota bacterium]
MNAAPDSTVPGAEFRLSNRESLPEFDLVLPHPDRSPTVTALLRVKDEERKLEPCLLSIIEVFDELVLVDNGSTDSTVEIARALAARHDAEGRLRIVSYPHTLARYGPEHDATPEDSVHSLVYFNNFGLSHCRSKYVCKWDGDMVLRRRARGAFLRLLARIARVSNECWKLKGQTVYRDLSGDYFEARGEVNKEVMMFPNELEYRFGKYEHWEGIGRAPDARVRTLRPVCFYELKYAEEDEFSHWSTGEFPSDRKRREWENFQAVKEGDTGSRRRFRPLPRDFLDRQVQ